MNRLTMKRRFAIAVALLAFALVATACGGDDTADDATTTAAPEATPTTTATTAPDATTATTGAPGTTTSAAPEVGTALAGLTKVDDLTFTVELSAPNPEFPLTLGYAAYFPLPDVALEDPVAFEEAPIGNGPFMMNGVWEHDVQIATTAYPDYQGPNPAQIQDLTFQIYADVLTAYPDVLGGNLDILNGVPPDFLGTYQDEFPDRNAEFGTTSFNYLGFPGYLNDQFTLEHRRALSMAVDRELIAEQIFLGARDPAFSAIPPNLFGRDEVCEFWNYDPEAAAALWDAAPELGPFEVWFNAGAGHDLWVDAVVNQWAQNLGLDPASVTYQQLEFAEYLEVVDDAALTGPFRLGWGQDYPSPYNFLFPLYHSANAAPVGSNATFYNNPEFDELLASGVEAFAASGNIEDALPDYYAAEELLCNDVNIMPMFFGKTQVVWNEGIDNVFVDSYGDLGYSAVTADDGSVTYQIGEPANLMPTTSNESEGISVLRALFTGLVGFDPETNEAFNAHAASIETEDGGTTWTITLNPGWTFHNGDPVTADSYINAWNFGAVGANGQQNNSFYSNIVGYEELNPPTDTTAAG